MAEQIVPGLVQIEIKDQKKYLHIVEGLLSKLLKSKTHEFGNYKLRKPEEQADDVYTHRAKLGDYDVFFTTSPIGNNKYGINVFVDNWRVDNATHERALHKLSNSLTDICHRNNY